MINNHHPKKNDNLPEKKRTVWVTGASSGIGAALVEQLAAAGDFVIASARSEDKLAHMVECHPERVRALACDVTDQVSMEKAEQRLQDITDYLDVLVVCAGNCEYDNGPDLDLDMYRRVMEANYFGAIRTVKAALPLLRASEQKPVIMGVGSLVIRAAFPRAEAYGASKAAFDYLFQSLRVDLLDQGMDVILVRPGFVDTPLTQKNDFDMPFLVDVNEAAGRIVEGLNRRRLFIEFPRKFAWILKLAHIFPAFWLRYCAPGLRKKQ